MADCKFDLDAYVSWKETHRGGYLPDALLIDCLNNIADDVCIDYFTVHSVSFSDLLDPDAWQIHFQNIRTGLEREFLKNRVPEAEGQKYLDASYDLRAIVVAHGLVTADAVRVVSRDERGATHCIYAIRAHDGRVPMGFWDTVVFSNSGAYPLKDILSVLHKNIFWSAKHKRELGLAFERFFLYAKDAVSPAAFEYKLISCKNGIYDGRQGHRMFTPWTDVDAINARYPGLCMTWRLHANYNPDASCSRELDPKRVISAYFDPRSEKGQASYRVAMQTLQFAARGYAGKGGNLVLLCCLDSYYACDGEHSFRHLVEGLFEGENCNSSTLRYVGQRERIGFLEKQAIHTDDYWDSRKKLKPNLLSYVCYEPVHEHMKTGADLMTESTCVKIIGYDGKPDLDMIADKQMQKHCICIWFLCDFLLHKKMTTEEYIRNEAVAECLLKYLCEMPFLVNFKKADRVLLNACEK